jgi:hypothetical protein
LDQDGFVGNRDLVMAKHFDKDMDGKLNAVERANAEEAIKNGFENNFVWGLEQSGPENSRIMQKRGEVVQGEDFTLVGTTYPVHQLS